MTSLRPLPIKRQLLVKAGLPRRAMRMTVVLDQQGAGHAVLTLRTSEGDFILDNLQTQILRWDRTGYLFVKRESDVQTSWLALDPADQSQPVASVQRRPVAQISELSRAASR